jgi:hypothetical protein
MARQDGLTAACAHAAVQSHCSHTTVCTAQVANTLWSYATLGHDPGAQLLDAIAAHMCDRMHVFRPQAISNSLWVRQGMFLLMLQPQPQPWLLHMPSYQHFVLQGSICGATPRPPCPLWWFLRGCRRMRSCSTTRGASCWRPPAAAPWQRCTSTRRRWASTHTFARISGSACQPAMASVNGTRGEEATLGISTGVEATTN